MPLSSLKSCTVMFLISVFDQIGKPLGCVIVSVGFYFLGCPRRTVCNSFLIADVEKGGHNIGSDK